MTSNLYEHESNDAPNRKLAVGLIPDGNRRWAAFNNTTLYEAYTLAAQKTAEIIMALRDRSVPNLFIYGASAENVRHRNPDTLDIIVQAFVETFHAALRNFGRSGIRLTVAGDVDSLSPAVVAQFERINSLHDPFGTMNCVIVFNYTIEWEFKQAIATMGKHGAPKASTLLASLPTRHWPKLDLVIRTAGEKRLSEFLPLQTMYAELFFIETLWPDFTIKELDAVLTQFFQRKRTFGR